MPHAPRSIERPWLVVVAFVPTTVAVSFGLYVAKQHGVTSWSTTIDNMAQFLTIGAMVLLSRNGRVGLRLWHWLVAGGALGVLAGVARWIISFTADAPANFVRAVATNAVVAAAWMLVIGCLIAPLLRHQARLAGRA